RVDHGALWSRTRPARNRDGVVRDRAGGVDDESDLCSNHKGESFMSEVIRWSDQFYILASSSLAENRVEVLKHGETFAVFDRYGDIHQVVPGPQGLYHEGTWFLSQFELTLGTHRTLLLSTTVKEDNALLTVDLTNPDLTSDARHLVPRGTLHLCRTRFLWKGTCHERIRIH